MRERNWEKKRPTKFVLVKQLKQYGREEKQLKIAREKISLFNYCVKMCKLNFEKKEKKTTSDKLTSKMKRVNMDEKWHKRNYILYKY